MKHIKLYESFNKIINESFNDIPEPELMDVDEWDEEVTNAKEVDFTQKEKELFISLSDTISVKNKRYMPEIGKSSLFFQMINGDLIPNLKETTPIRNISTYKNDDEFYYVNIWGRDADDKVYRCDGYECWEKFLKEIFQGYRELTGQNKTNESMFDAPEPELMDDSEWDEVDNAQDDFNQKEKELFISLSDTISAKHKIDLDALEIGDSQLSFSMVNGHDGIYPDLRSTTVIRSLTSYKNDDEFYYVNVWEGNDIDGVHKSYRCDGDECWEKFLKEIFKGYRDLINNKTKTNESFGGPYYKEIDPIDFFRANGIGLNEKELEEISRIINEKQGWIQKYSGAMITLHIPRQIGTVTLDEHTNLKKGYDEFYYVHYDIMNRKEFYEADQFDGLLKLLDDIL